MALPFPSCGIIKSLEFKSFCSSQCTIHTKSGEFEDSLNKPEDWEVVWTGEVQVGYNKIGLNLHVEGGERVAVRIACHRGLWVSRTVPEADPPLILRPGRCVRSE